MRYDPQGTSGTGPEEKAGDGNLPVQAGRGGSGPGGGMGAGGGQSTSGGTSFSGSTGVGGTIPVGATGGGGGTPGGNKGGKPLPSFGGQETCGPGGCISDTTDPPIDPPGPVLCGGVECGAREACCLATGRCFEAGDASACPLPDLPEDDWGRAPCASNAHCGERQFCKLDNGLCQGAGYCNPIGNCGGCAGACEICGCDGNTYPNYQTACLASTNTVSIYGGGCGEIVEVGDEGEPVRQRRACGKQGDCVDGEACCAITGFCYDAREPDLCRMPPEGTNFPCLTDEQCLPYHYCAADGCSGPGGCRPLGSESDCGVTLEPVCGCDGTTYTSRECAAMRGVRVASAGECEE
ncbi:MAG TPA: hypothetical protein VGK73_26545 [Polyangiaceae bacterium]